MGRIVYDGETVVDREEALEILGISKRWLWDLVKQDIILTVKLPEEKKPYYYLRSIESYQRAKKLIKNRTGAIIRLLTRVDELEHKMSWLMNNMPAPIEEYHDIRKIMNKNHPDLF